MINRALPTALFAALVALCGSWPVAAQREPPSPAVRDQASTAERNTVAPPPDDPSGTQQLPAGKPNIVLFYLDDVALTDGRLWGNPQLTPTIYDLFVAHGTTFTNAVGETPLCCPGRGSVLTGLHTHNDGVVANNARLFNPVRPWRRNFV